MSARRSTAPGLLLLQGARGKVEAWVRRGTVPAHVISLDRWTGVVPAGPSLAAAPYEDGLAVLTARPVPSPLRRSLGFFVHGERAVVVLHAAGVRTPSRWAVWSAGSGAVVLPGHQPATPADLLQAAGAQPARRGEVVAVLRERSGAPVDMLAALVTALELPGRGLLRGTLDPADEGGRLITPSARTVDRFDRAVREEREVSAEMEER